MPIRARALSRGGERGGLARNRRRDRWSAQLTPSPDLSTRRGRGVRSNAAGCAITVGVTRTPRKCGELLKGSRWPNAARGSLLQPQIRQDGNVGDALDQIAPRSRRPAQQGRCGGVRFGAAADEDYTSPTNCEGIIGSETRHQLTLCMASSAGLARFGRIVPGITTTSSVATRGAHVQHRMGIPSCTTRAARTQPPRTRIDVMIAAHCHRGEGALTADGAAPEVCCSRDSSRTGYGAPSGYITPTPRVLTPRGMPGEMRRTALYRDMGWPGRRGTASTTLSGNTDRRSGTPGVNSRHTAPPGHASSLPCHGPNRNRLGFPSRATMRW